MLYFPIKLIFKFFCCRQALGEFHCLVQELRLDTERFQCYFRMTPDQFDYVLGLISPTVTKLNTNYRDPIPAAERLAITLRWVTL